MLRIFIVIILLAVLPSKHTKSNHRDYNSFYDEEDDDDDFFDDLMMFDDIDDK